MKADRATLYFRSTELTQTTLPKLVEQLAAFTATAAELEPRSYPGYPRVTLPATRARRLCPLDRTLRARRSATVLGEELPDAAALSRILHFGHGYERIGSTGSGIVPSAGGLQALELYLVVLDAAVRAPADATPGSKTARFGQSSAAASWLPPGLYHYDRPGHHLSRIAASPVTRPAWEELIPSLRLLTGSALIWLLVGDLDRVARKYGSRAYRFLLLEAGHLMQNLCLLATSVGLCTVPLGACLERAIGDALSLPATDAVLYAGALGIVAGKKGRVQ